MTSRERVATLLKKQIPDRMGLYEHLWGETIPQAWEAQGYPKDARLEAFFDYDIVAGGPWIDNSLVPGHKEILEETDEWQVIRDGRMATTRTWKKRSGTPEHVGFEITTPDAWRKYRDRLREVNPARLGDLEKNRKDLAEARASGRFVVLGNCFVWEIMRATLGDVNFLPALLTEPEWIHDFCGTYLEFYKQHYDRYFREVGRPDGFWIYEDFGYRNGLFCSPATLKEMVMPYEKALVSFFKDHGLPVILHTCGDIRKAVPLFIEAGFDCLQPMEAKAGCNVLEFAATYGSQIAYMGNIDVVVLNTNRPAQVKKEILSKLKTLKKQRIPYFFHSDHSIPPTVNLKTYQYALQLFRENSAY